MNVICRLIGHAWERDQSFGYEYVDNWTGEGMPPIKSSWRGDACTRGDAKRRTTTIYTEPGSVRDFVRGELR